MTFLNKVREAFAGNSEPAGPDGYRAYAIGDVHGRLDLLRRVKALPAAPVVVAMTLFHSPEAAAAAVAAGAVGLVGKDGFVPGLTQLLARLFPKEISA